MSDGNPHPMRARLVVLLGVLLGGWMLFDGLRALVIGDYVTPASGEYAGRLGPWADLLRRFGVEPRGMLTKVAHVVIGALWLVASVGLFRRWSIGAAVGRSAAVMSLWYLPFGTLIGLGVLWLLHLRQGRS